MISEKNKLKTKHHIRCWSGVEWSGVEWSGGQKYERANLKANPPWFIKSSIYLKGAYPFNLKEMKCVFYMVNKHIGNL